MPTNEMRRREWITAGYKSDMGSAIACSPPADSSSIRLYNLTSVKHALSNIEKRRLKVSRFADLNDPFELLAANFPVDRATEPNPDYTYLLRASPTFNPAWPGFLWVESGGATG